MTDKLELPGPAINFVPHRHSMLLINRLLARDKAAGTARSEAFTPVAGLFVVGQGVGPEYFIELIAQTAAAATGYDGLVNGTPPNKGFLVGVDEFSWPGQVTGGEILQVEIRKTFAFGQVSIMEGWVRDSPGRLIAHGKVRVWEESN